MMHHTVYKITNTINGKIYVGVHSTENIDDGYLGSGRTISNALRKYGKYNFLKTILMFCETSDEAMDIERVLVCEKFIRRKDVYNEKIGGKGNTKGHSYYTDDSGKLHYLSREEFESRSDLHSRKHTEEDKLRMSEIRRNFLDSITREEFEKLYCGKPCSEEKKEKISAKQRGVKRRSHTSEEKLNAGEKSRNFWESCTEEERKSLCKTKTVESEDARRRKISESSRKPKKKSTCPHCNKTGGAGSMTRYHFDNCKFKEQ